jgi:hypothetical protein
MTKQHASYRPDLNDMGLDVDWSITILSIPTDHQFKNIWKGFELELLEYTSSMKNDSAQCVGWAAINQS